jgi:hypothetical protein
MAMHANQLTVTVETARRLAGEQFPAWRGLPVRELRTQGTVNAIRPRQRIAVPRLAERDRHGHGEARRPEQLARRLRLGDERAPRLVHVRRLELEPRGQPVACDDLERERGRAWAFEQAMGLVWYYAASNPAMARTGRRTLARITG